MSYKETLRFESEKFNSVDQQYESLPNGVSYFAKDFQRDIMLSVNTYNVSYGLSHGWQCRPGVSPIPGQNVTTQPGSLTLPFPLDAMIASSHPRYKVFGVFPVTLAAASTTGPLGTPSTCYLWVISARVSLTAQEHLLYALSAKTQGASNTPLWSPGLECGLSAVDYASSDTAGFRAWRYQPYLYTGSSNSSCAYQQLSQGSWTQTLYAKSAVFSVAGMSVAAKYQAAVNIGSAATSTDPGNLQFTTTGSFYGGYGWTQEFAYLNQKTTPRSLTVLNSTANYPGSFVRGYQYTLQDSNTLYSFQFEQIGSKNYNFPVAGATSTFGRLDGATPTPSTATGSLVIDDQAAFNTAHTIIFSAPGRAVGAIIQEQYVSADNTVFQELDPTALVLQPISIATYDYENAAAYKENGIPKLTCFAQWPSFTQGTALATGGVRGAAKQVRLGAANSGTLRANTVYEFSLSFYDKTIGYESNVGAPVRVQTGTNDYVALTIYRDVTTDTTDGGTRLQYTVIGGGVNAVFPTPSNKYNVYQFRLYYRALGTMEWLPALFIDAAQYFLDPTMDTLWACQAPIAGLPGGQPGGFNDYSMLPNDKWFDVLEYQGRAFWISAKQVVFSYRGQLLQYSVRNSVPPKTGQFKGALVHAYPGQALQDSRFVMFGTNEIYIGRFKGQGYFAQQPVTVSPGVTATYPVDGSDFTIDVWTSFTAFSSRAAVICDGILLYWGPQGIFADEGNTVPDRISANLEPYLLSLYDSNKTDQIFAYYLSATKEAVWVYPPAGISNVSYAVVYNCILEQFSFWRFPFVMTWAQPMNAAFADTTLSALGGQRIVIGVKTSSTTNTAMFADSLCAGGDMTPTRIGLVNQIFPSGGNVVLTMSNTLGNVTLSAGDVLSLVDYQKYSGRSEVLDGLYPVVSATSTTVTINPLGVTFPSVTLAQNNVFPCYSQAQNGITMVSESTYWAPNGVRFWGLWLWGHFISKAVLLQGQAPSMTVSAKSNMNQTYQSTTVSITNNSDGNHQILLPLTSNLYTVEGQAIKFKIQRIHIGGQVSTQYVGFDVVPKDPENVRVFEKQS